MEENSILMFNRRGIFRNLATACAALMLAGNAVTVFSEEPAKEKKESLKPELDPEGKSLLEFRAYRPGDSIFRNGSGDAPAIAPRLSPPPAPRISRQEMERLDREKNWIFLSPKDADRSETPEEILGVDSFLSGSEKSKSALTRFLENKPADETSLRRTEPLNRFGFDPSRNQNLAAPFSPGQPDFMANGRKGLSQFESQFGNNSAASQSAPGQAWSSPAAEKARNDRRQKMAAFESLFAPLNPGLNSSISSPLITDNIFSLPGANPNSPPRNNELFERPSMISRSSPLQNDPLQIPVPGGSRNPLTPEPTANMRAFGPSAAPAPTPEPPRSVSRPVTLPIPRRNL